MLFTSPSQLYFAGRPGRVEHLLGALREFFDGFQDLFLRNSLPLK